MEAKIIKELDDFQGRACLVKLEEKYFVVSSVDSAFDTGLPETLVFPSDKNGKVASWGEVAGGRNVSREEAIRELEGGKNDRLVNTARSMD